jgi:hypothetical protein
LLVEAVLRHALHRELRTADRDVMGAQVLA